MNSARMIRIGFAATLLLGVCCSCALDAQTWNDQLQQKFTAVIQEQMEARKIPALSIAVGVDNQLVWSHGFGKSDLENDVSATEKTVYRTASIAKAMTAVAAMKMVEQGKLKLDRPVGQYLEQWPEKRWPVTSRQLLGHLGGIRHYKSAAEASSTQSFPSARAALKTFNEDPLLHAPGTKYQYSTFGFNLLGAAMEQAANQSFLEIMEQLVFEPAGMKQTTTDDVRQIIPHRARGYERADLRMIMNLPQEARSRVKAGEVYNASLHDTSMKVPGGGLVSTSADLIRFVSAVNRGQLCSKESVELMWTEQKTADGKATGYGLGWVVGEVDGHRVIGHSGGQAGTSTCVMMLPDKNVAVAVMCNLRGLGLSGPTRDFLKEIVAAP